MQQLRDSLFIRHLLAISMLLLLGLAGSDVQGDMLVWKTLKSKQNTIVLMRNSHLDRSVGDPTHWDESGSCSGEVLLSQEGKEHAVQIGKMFKHQGIKPIVISSPMCRCVQTAELAFGDDFVTDPLLREIASADSAGYDAFLSKANELLLAYRGNAPVVFVSHRPNIEALTFELISVGEILLGTIDDSGEIEVLGKYEF